MIKLSKSWAAWAIARVQLGQKPTILVLLTVALFLDLLSTIHHDHIHYTHMKEHPQQHKGIKSNTHIECGFIIYNGELHNVGIHWLLRVAGKGRKKIWFKFSFQEKKPTRLSLQVHPTTWEESLSYTTKQNIHKETRVTSHAKAAMPVTPSLCWLSQAVSRFYWEGISAPQLAHLSVLKAEQMSCNAVICDTHTVTQQEQAAKLGLNISIQISPFCNTLQRLLKGRRTQEGMTTL